MYIVLIMGLIIHQMYYKTKEELVFMKKYCWANWRGTKELDNRVLQYDVTYELVRLTEGYIHSFIGDDVQVADWDYGYKIMYDSMAQEIGKAVNRWYTCGDEKKSFFGNFLIYAQEYDDDSQSHVEEVQARFIPVSSVKYQFNLSRKMREVIITTRLSPEIGGYDVAYKVSDIFKKTPLNQLKIYREYFRRGIILPRMTTELCWIMPNYAGFGCEKRSWIKLYLCPKTLKIRAF